MVLTYRRSLTLALAALLLLALAGAVFPGKEAALASRVRPVARRGEDCLYAGADFEAAETLLFNESALLDGLVLYTGPNHPLPEGARAGQARDVRGMVGLYVPADARVSLSQETIYALCAMVAERFPVYLTVCAGMRSPAQQRQLHNALFQKNLASMAAREALQRANRDAPVDFTSEHHLATAFDVRLEGELNWLENDPLLRNADGVWLCENAHRFGFIRRYPPDKAHITGITGEETHFRYVGRAHACAMRAASWCLEEYLDALRATGAFTLQHADEAPVYILCAPLQAGAAAFACPAGYTGTAGADNSGYAVCVLTPAQ